MGVAANAFDRVQQAERVTDVADQLLGLNGGEAGGLDPIGCLHDPVGHPFGHRQGLRSSVFDGHVIQRTESRRQPGVSFLRKRCELVIEHNLEALNDRLRSGSCD